MSITLEQAKTLKQGQELIVIGEYYADGKREKRVRVSGQVKTWKRDPERIRVPLKYGLYDYGELTNGTWEGSGSFTLHLKDVRLPGEGGLKNDTRIH